MVMLLGLLLALLGFAPAPDPALEEAWEEWKSFYAKEYPREAEATRREVWEKNLRRIQQHNWEQSQGQHTFRLAMNHYGDLVPADGPGTFPGDPSRHPGFNHRIIEWFGSERTMKVIES